MSTTALQVHRPVSSNESRIIIPEPVGITGPLAEVYTRAMQEASNLLASEDVARRFATVILSELRTRPELQRCTPESLLMAVVEMAEHGLDPSGTNECFLIPYDEKDQHGRVIRTVAQMQVGYVGHMKLARSHPEVVDIWADEVCENDDYEFHGKNAKPHHAHPKKFAPRGRYIGYYAVAMLIGERYRAIEMSVEEIKAHAQHFSMNANRKVWAEYKGGGFRGMAIKTVIKKLCNPREIPMSVRVAQIMERQEVSAIIEGELAEETKAVLAREAQKSIVEHTEDLYPPAHPGTSTPVTVPQTPTPVTPAPVAETDQAPPTVVQSEKGQLLNQIEQAIEQAGYTSQERSAFRGQQARKHGKKRLQELEVQALREALASVSGRPEAATHAPQADTPDAAEPAIDGVSVDETVGEETTVPVLAPWRQQLHQFAQVLDDADLAREASALAEDAEATETDGQALLGRINAYVDATMPQLPF